MKSLKSRNPIHMPHVAYRAFATVSALALTATLASCQVADTVQTVVSAEASTDPSAIHPELWPNVKTPPLDIEVEIRVDSILSKLTLEQKVGQVIQADSGSATAEDVRKYRLGSVLSGGNSAPGLLPYADTETWLEAADAYFEASIDPEGVEIAVPMIWGIDAVHGHANLKGATIFPHNIGLGATRNADLIERIAAATAIELSVSGHDWTFAPTLAVPQNDRWGRTYEGFSEDPSIVASFADRIVYGLQGRDGDTHFMGLGKVISSAKHFVADGGTKNGIDQGDALISETDLRDIHSAGYSPALEAGALTVMASFSAWQGIRMHGNEDLLTDVLKERMNFKGFVVGDWNGHGLINGCTITDCPESLMAGLDMYMAPDSWHGLYESTLAHVQSGRISMERLDDAVRRILRVKVISGVFEKGAPSTRPLAGDISVLGSTEHRALARRAVRESLVLLKNNDSLLPLKADQTVLVVGPGADSISKAAGGWTLSWQGLGHSNDEFPGAHSILSGIEEAVSAGGGEIIFDPDGASDVEADVVIAVYGEDPYAEFRGDIPNVDFIPNDFDTAKLAHFKESGMPVVSVFLSGRPLWANPEINLSDAFVAAWLPGSEGGGIADILFQTDPGFDFTGQLSFSWPKLATQVELNAHKQPYDPLFPLGYGLSLGDDGNLAPLSEDSGIAEGQTGLHGVFLTDGAIPEPWGMTVNSVLVNHLPFEGDGIRITAVDHTAQEDALQVDWAKPGTFAIEAYGHDFAREANGAMELVFNAVSRQSDPNVQFGMGCDTDLDNIERACLAYLPITLSAEWNEYRVSLSCFSANGVDMYALDRPLILKGEGGQSIALSEARIEADTDGAANCGDAPR